MLPRYNAVRDIRQATPDLSASRAHQLIIPIQNPYLGQYTQSEDRCESPTFRTRCLTVHEAGTKCLISTLIIIHLNVAHQRRQGHRYFLQSPLEEASSDRIHRKGTNARRPLIDSLAGRVDMLEIHMGKEKSERESLEQAETSHQVSTRHIPRLGSPKI